MKIVNEKKAYEDLANAIILQSIDDFEHVHPAKSSTLYAETSNFNLEEILLFINSDWFKLLTNIEPEIIKLEMLKRRYKNENRLHDRRKTERSVDY